MNSEVTSAQTVTAHTSLGPDALRFRSLRGREGLSQLYEFDIELVSGSPSIDMKRLLGESLTLEIRTRVGTTRFLGGQGVRCEMLGRETTTSRSYIYRVTVRPWLWYLTKCVDCRIFQNRSVVDIILEVVAKYGYPVQRRLVSSYRTRECCVQYQESDFAFISRLMEHEGIYYYFRHEQDQQTLVLADDMSSHDPLPGYGTIPYLPPDRLVLADEEGVDEWRPSEELRTGAYVVDDYDFRKPGANLSQRRSSGNADRHGSYEKYLWQGGYVDAAQGEHYARVRLEEEQSEQARVSGHTSILAMAPGYLFALKNCPRQSENRQYLAVDVQYEMQERGYATGSGTSAGDVRFCVQPATLPYRSPCLTPVPKASGPQTAEVVGPAGEEIWTDRYGRVKLQFRWDRHGRRDENSSCWVRVSDAWAGTGYGSLHVPRIGQEVVVDFVDGALDRPLVTGRIYNADQMPPFSLPESATQSGFVSRTPHGSSANANMFRFEDKAGAEQIKVHAERNYDVSVENDATVSVAARHLTQVGFAHPTPESARSPVEHFAQAIRTGPAPTVSDPSPPALQGLQQSAGNVAGALQRITALITGSSTPVHGTTVNGASTSVTFGDTISVATGDVTSITNGQSVSEVNGSTTSKVAGHTKSEIKGNSSSKVMGDAESTVTGSSVSRTGQSTSLTGSSISLTGQSASFTGIDTSARGMSCIDYGFQVSISNATVSSVGINVSRGGINVFKQAYLITL